MTMTIAAPVRGGTMRETDAETGPTKAETVDALRRQIRLARRYADRVRRSFWEDVLNLYHAGLPLTQAMRQEAALRYEIRLPKIGGRWQQHPVGWYWQEGE